jgi:homogentisate 1,2-dioxygenase
LAGERVECRLAAIFAADVVGYSRLLGRDKAGTAFLPKSTTFRQLPDGGDSTLLVIESPARLCMAEHENVGRHTPVDPMILDVPDIADHGFPSQAEYEVRLKHGLGRAAETSAIFYKNDPLKVIGWKGDLFSFRLNVRAILPIRSDRLHIPPSSWVAFEAPGFCVLTIPPHDALSDLNAEELPSYHRNVVMDKVMFSHADEDPNGRRPVIFRYTPQAILHAADEATRAEFQKRRHRGQPRTPIMVVVDTYRPFTPTSEFVKLAR